MKKIEENKYVHEKSLFESSAELEPGKFGRNLIHKPKATSVCLPPLSYIHSLEVSGPFHHFTTCLETTFSFSEKWIAAPPNSSHNPIGGSFAYGI